MLHRPLHSLRNLRPITRKPRHPTCRIRSGAKLNRSRKKNCLLLCNQNLHPSISFHGNTNTRSGRDLNNQYTMLDGYLQNQGHAESDPYLQNQEHVESDPYLQNQEHAESDPYLYVQFSSAL